MPRTHVHRVAYSVGMSRLRWLFSVLLLLVSGAWSQQPVRLADAICARCHADITAKYLATPMANASGLATDHLLPGEFTQTSSGVQYTVGLDQRGRAVLRFSDAHDARLAGTRDLSYFLGSGHLGVTYLYLQEGYLLEAPVAWYASTGRYDMKPGFAATTEMPAALPVEAGCLRCHMSGVASPVNGSTSQYAGLPFAQTGITCESCHGDTAAHVRTGGRAPVVNPAKLDPERRDAVCISCHLEGDVTVKRAGRSVLDYRPGEKIADYLAYFIFPSANPLDRGVSEVEQFAGSACRRASGERMSCSSCHDPHGSPAPAQRVAFYRAKCLTCHNAPAFAATHHVENLDCTGCHMPKSGAADVPHVAWTDHRILRSPPPPAAPKTTPLLTLSSPLDKPTSSAALKPIFSPEADVRDRAMAHYTAIMTGQLSDRAAALAELQRAYADGARDVPLMEAMGVLNALAGNRAVAEARFRELLGLQPTNLTALSDLAIYFAQKGDVVASVQMWTKAFERNQNDLGLARNLATGECLVGNEAAAKKVMAEALTFSPGYRKGWTFRCQ